MGMFSWNWRGISSERFRYRRTVQRIRRNTRPPTMMPVVIIPEYSLKVSWPCLVAPRLAP